MSWSSIFSPETLNKTVDAIIETGDALVYTAEEKAKAVQLGIETKIKILPLFEPFKVTQRLISLAFTYNFIFAFWVGVLIYFFGDKEQLEGFINLVSVFQLGWIMLAIVSFYFGGGFINSVKGIKK